MKNIANLLNDKWVYIIYAIELAIFTHFQPALHTDEALKYWMASGMMDGKLLYTDLNAIVPPVCYGILYLALHIYNSLLTLRILNFIIWMIIFVLMHKIIRKYTDSKLFIFTVNSMLLIFLMYSYTFFYDYNLMETAMLLAIMYLILNKDFTTKTAFLIAVLCTMIVWTKHSVGGVYFFIIAIVILFYKKNTEDFNKKILVMFATGIVISALFVAGLLFYGVWNDFIDIIFMGLSDFNSTASFQLGVHLLIIVIFVVFILSCMLLSRLKVADKLKCTKAFDKDMKVMLFFVLGSFSFVYPIFDYNHAMGMMIMLTLAVSKIVCCKIKVDKIIPRGVIGLSALALSFETAWTLESAVSEDYVCNHGFYKGFYFSEFQQKRIDDLSNMIDSSEKEVYIIDKFSVIYEVGLGRNMGYYDMLWEGNTGCKSQLEYVKMLADKECIIVMDPNNQNHFQWDSRMYQYVSSNFKLMGELDGFELYDTSYGLED